MTTNRTSGWITTYTGTEFYPLEPLLEEIHIEDIAQSLSMLCRFNGHCNSFYSVAEHSCHVADLCSKEHFLEGLLHDASEAYLTDIPRPLKPYMPEYKQFEHHLQSMIYERFGLTSLNEEEIKLRDNSMLYVEGAVLFKPGTMDTWQKPMSEQLPKVNILCWDPYTAKKEFLKRFHGAQ